MSVSSIPFLDLISPHRELEQELVSTFVSVIRSASFIGGPLVENFENSFASFCQVNHCVGVNSGTDALRFALIAAGVKPGDVVVTVPNTFIATTEAISQTGAEPKFVDIDEHTYNIDVAKLGEFFETQCVVDKSSGRLLTLEGRPVSAIVPVHLYGQMADMDTILELAERYRLIVIEDACQAHGAEYFSRKQNVWRRAGSMGHAAAFSFYPGKNLGACGEGGAATTNDPVIAKTMRMLRDHGQAKKYYHDLEGYNGRLDSLQAGLLSAKLLHLDKWNAQRRAHAQLYNELFAGNANVVTPFEPAWSKAVYHLYVIQVEDREKVQTELSNAGIGTGIHYPIPLHLQKAYAHKGYAVGDFPVSEALAPKILSLPMFPGLTQSQLKQVAEQLEVISAVKLSRAAAASV